MLQCHNKKWNIFGSSNLSNMYKRICNYVIYCGKGNILKLSA